MKNPLALWAWGFFLWVWKVLGIKVPRKLLLKVMSTLDLTASVHLEDRPTSRGTRSRIDRFRARWDYLEAGKAVLATEGSDDTWTVTTFPGVATVQADSNFEYSEDRIFYGGRTYFVSNGLATALDDAGYDVTPAGFSSGFSAGFEVL